MERVITDVEIPPPPAVVERATPFVHERALVESPYVGSGTRVWAFAHVLPGARIGADCNICDGVFVENDVIVGSRVTVKCGVQLWDGVTLEDDVFVGPNATFTNDPFPRSKVYSDRPARTVVERGASIGANATVLPGVRVGAHAMVGAGAVVTHDVPPNAVVVGNPARVVRFVDAPERDGCADAPSAGAAPEPIVRGATLYRLPVVRDGRGTLSFGEVEAQLPFVPRRYFVISDVPAHAVRGAHAHRVLEEFLTCVRGSCAVMVDDGVRRAEVVLDSPAVGLHIGPDVWRVHYRHAPGTVLVVLASDVYREEDYVRDYRDFRGR